MDFEALNAELCQNSFALLEEWIPGGTVENGEYVVLNPTRQDSDPGSFKINLESGKWLDFAREDRGKDLISLYAYIHNIGQGDAAKELSRGEYREIEKKPVPKPKRIEHLQQIFDVPESAWGSAPTYFPKKEKGKWTEYPFTKKWPYHTHKGRVFGYIGKIETPGGKETIPVGFFKTEENPGGAWVYRSFTQPRILFAAHNITYSHGSQIFLVEGEKCAEALQEKLGSTGIATTWAGGGKATALSDFGILQNRSVIIWPDWDRPGIQTANKLKIILEKVGAARIGCIRLENLKRQPKKGWDCADLIEKNPDQLFPFIKSQLEKDFTGFDVDSIFPDPNKPPDNTIPFLPPSGPAPVPPPPDEPPDDESGSEIINGEAPFRCLGHDQGGYYYFPRESQQIRCLKSEQHSKLQLISLCSLNWWEGRFHKKNGADWDAAANELIRVSHKVGVYNPDMKRGSGAWWDRKKVVLHFGNKLRVDGQVYQLSEFKTQYIYEAGPPVRLTDEKPATVTEAKEFLEILEMLKWEKSIYGTLAAGWTVLAPICGALRWRPHIWITGGAGTGKTFILDRIIKEICDPCIYVQSVTSEAGIRQRLKNDAKPVIFDESEGEDKAGQKRVQYVLELMRQASTDTGATILKGTTSGIASSFNIRSMFCLASITPGLTQQADESRVSVLTLKSPDPDDAAENMEHFANLQVKMNQVMSSQYCASIRSRAIEMVPIIRHNAERFALAFAELLGNRRIGDQIGALLAGAYALISDSKLSLIDAREWLKKHDWEEQKEIGVIKDENNCLNALVTEKLTLVTSTERFEKSVFEFLEIIRNSNKAMDPTESHGLPDPITVHDHLKRIGIRYDERADTILISDSHKLLRKILIDTAWSKNWGRLLKRLSGAANTPAVRFLGITTRATSIPWVTAFGPDDQDGQESMEFSEDPPF